MATARTRSGSLGLQLLDGTWTTTTMGRATTRSPGVQAQISLLLVFGLSACQESVVVLSNVIRVAGRWEVIVSKPLKVLVNASQIGIATARIPVAPRAHSVEVESALRAVAAVIMNVALLQTSAQSMKRLCLQNNPLDPLLQERKFLQRILLELMQ
jgi:hypothetical protein